MSHTNSPANVASPASPAHTVGYASAGSTPASDRGDATESDDEVFPEEEAQVLEDESQKSSAKDDDIRHVRQLEQDGELPNAFLDLLAEFRDQQTSKHQLHQLLKQMQRITENTERQLEFLHNSECRVNALLQKIREKQQHAENEMEQA